MASNELRGCSPVTILVLGICIAGLASLILPAIQGPVRDNRATQCSNNLRLLGMGTLLYHKTYQRFPGYRNHLRPGPKVVTWAVPIFPYIGKAKVYNEWAKLNFNDTVGNENVPRIHIELLVCPSNPPRAEQVGPTDYVCNGGFARTTDAKGEVFADDQNDQPYNGVFLDHSRYGHEATPIMTLNFLNANDGSSNTLMLGENRLADSWSVWEHVENHDNYPAKHLMTFVWHRSGSLATASLHPERRINGHLDGATLKDLNYATLSSYHPQGVNVVFCDGHSRFLNETIDYHVYTQLMTPHGFTSFTVGDSPTNIPIKKGAY